jgi:hypothetical protein
MYLRISMNSKSDCGRKRTFDTFQCTQMLPAHQQTVCSASKVDGREHPHMEAVGPLLFKTEPITRNVVRLNSNNYVVVENY